MALFRGYSFAPFAAGLLHLFGTYWDISASLRRRD